MQLAKMLSSSGRVGLVPRLVLVIVGAFGILWISSLPRQYDVNERLLERKEQYSPSNSPYPVEINKLVVTLTTTAIETLSKLPMPILLADTIYHDNINIVSDLHMDIAAFHVPYVLVNIDSRLENAKPDLQRPGEQVRLAEPASTSIALRTPMHRERKT
jgi:hypothetical protein